MYLVFVFFLAEKKIKATILKYSFVSDALGFNYPFIFLSSSGFNLFKLIETYIHRVHLFVYVCNSSFMWSGYEFYNVRNPNLPISALHKL